MAPSEFKMVDVNEAVRLTGVMPSPAARIDLLASWKGMGGVRWHWSMAGGTLEQAIAYHRSLGDEVLLVDTKSKYLPSVPKKEEKPAPPPLSLPGLPHRQVDPEIVRGIQFAAIFLLLATVISPIWFHGTFVTEVLASVMVLFISAAVILTVVAREE